MSEVIKTVGQLIPGDVNTPLDARTRVNTLADIANIQNPFVGCMFYCAEDGKFYVVKTLKSATISGETVVDGAIDAYEEFKGGSTPTIGENGNWFIDGVDTGVRAEGQDGADGNDGEVQNLRVAVTSVNADGDIVLDDPNLFPVAIITNKGNVYSIDNGAITTTTESWIIDIAPFLAYDNSSKFSGTWYIFCAGGVKGDQGWSFDPDARGLLADKSTYDGESAFFSFLDIENGIIYFKRSNTSGDWTNGIPFRGERGYNGYTFIPSVSADGTVSWTNNGGLSNPAEVNIKGKDGITFTPSVSSEGIISWTNDGGLSNPSEVNIKGSKGDTGTIFTPSVSSEGIISWSNDGGLENPTAISIKGNNALSVTTPVVTVLATDSDPTVDVSMDSAGVVTFAFGLPKGIKGDTGTIFTPSVSSEGVISWTNDGGLENPTSVDIKGDKGSVFTPSVSSEGIISWSNDGGLSNPEAINIKGIKGDTGTTFTPSVSSEGIISWSNDGGLSNPEAINIKGDKGTLTVIISDTEPVDPVDGTIWIPSTEV